MSVHPVAGRPCYRALRLLEEPCLPVAERGTVRRSPVALAPLHRRHDLPHEWPHLLPLIEILVLDAQIMLIQARFP